MTARQVKRWAGVTGPDLRRRWGRESVFLFGSVTSTNDVARELDGMAAPDGTIVVCREQTAGRGRDGSTWVSPGGAGLYLSMLFRPTGEVIPPLVTILAGVDVALALNRGFPGLGASVKWPNDLMSADRKLGGILVEAAKAENGGHLLVVGVGLNSSRARLPDSLEGAVALDERVGQVDLADVGDAVIEGLERRVPSAQAQLEDAALDEVDRLDWLKNRRVAHRVGDAEPIVGVAAGIAPDGALLLRPDRGALRRVVAGSVQVVAD